MKKDSKIKIVVASGKGGVGKSMLASTLLMLFSKKYQVIAVDADVDAPNLNLWLGGVKKWDQIEKLSLSEKAVAVNRDCPECRQCAEICQFGALSFQDNRLKVNPFLCEGCGACHQVCPAGTIKMIKGVNAELMVKNDLFGFPLVSAQLYPGETGSGKIVDQIKEKAESFKCQIMILDAPAGTGCPVIAAVNGADFSVLITEPTPSGFSDMKRALTVVNHFKVPYGVVINKWDIDPAESSRLEKWAGDRLLGEISYDKRIFQAIADLKPIIETNLPVKKEIEEIYHQLEKVL